MLYTIQNEFLSVSADDQGGELHSLIYGGTEFLWQGDPAWWTGRAPILFPVIGRFRGATYLHNGKRYSLSQNHGFARRNKFNLAGNSGDELVFSLHDSEETRSVYPFEFELLVTYKLSGRSLHTSFKVTNKSGEDMYFSLGGHPAFNCPLFQGETFEDYEIIFNENETAGTHIVTKEEFMLDETAPFFNNSRQIPLNYELFQKYETLAFSNLKSTSAALRSCKTGAGITMDFTGFPYFGIWQPPGAPFVCLEPWQGIEDSPDSTENLCEKKGIMRLASKAEHTCTFTLTPHI
jgi:galactose mutarotase-like enzyme